MLLTTVFYQARHRSAPLLVAAAVALSLVALAPKPVESQGPAQAATTITVPGNVTVGPHRSADLILPLRRTADFPPGGTTINVLSVANLSDVSAAISDDGARLTIQVSEDQEIIPDAPCEPINMLPNDVVCPHGPDRLPPISFTTTALDTASDLLHSGSISYGGTLVFLATNAGSTGPLPAVGVTYRTERTDCCAAPAASVDVGWDGSTVEIAAPDGYSVEPADRGACSVSPDEPNVADCGALGVPPRLFAFTTSTIGQQRLVHATPLFPFLAPQISAPAGPGITGSPVLLAGSVTSSPPGVSAAPAIVAYIWDFGDGSTATGQSVSHPYAAAGVYTAELILADSSGPVTALSTILQVLPTGTPLPPATVDVSYPAGWNLVSAPSGTVLSGAADPIYGAAPFGYPNAYQPLPNDTPLQEGSGYWAYFDSPVTVTLRGPGRVFARGFVSQTYRLLGNPLTAPATVSGGVAYVWDPIAGQYRQTTTLRPGQGAWLYPSGYVSNLLISYATP
ncbi:MAG TPA: PKD domain-containing protein [Dehalococcoidia bacterium]|nr:PKD domain-containing protein [Dehalococcoidia bacterium]